MGSSHFLGEEVLAAVPHDVLLSRYVGCLRPAVVGFSGGSAFAVRAVPGWREIVARHPSSSVVQLFSERGYTFRSLLTGYRLSSIGFLVKIEASG